MLSAALTLTPRLPLHSHHPAYVKLTPPGDQLPFTAEVDMSITKITPLGRGGVSITSAFLNRSVSRIEGYMEVEQINKSMINL